MLFESPEQAFHYLQIVSGAAVALSSVEYVSLRREFLASGGFFASCGDWTRNFPALMMIRCLLGILFASCLIPGYYGTLLLGTLAALVLVTNRMLIFGLEAADQMISILLCAQLLAWLAPGNVSLEKACLWFVALQAALAYAVAGIAKLLKPAWRNGSYLRALLKTELFGHPQAERLLARGQVAKRLSMLLISLEALFPLALATGRSGCLFFVSCMFAMHLANAFVLGLNLFVWAFLATYPALLYCAASVYR